MASPNVDLFAKLLFFLCRFNWNNLLFPISLIVCRYIIPCGHVWQKLLNLQLDPSAIAVCAKVVMFSVISTSRACKLHSLWFAWYCNVPMKLNWKATAGWENGLAAWKITWSRACNNEEGPGDHVCFRGRSADRWPKSVSGRPTVDRCRSVVGRLSVTTFSTREIASKMVEKFNPSLNYNYVFCQGTTEFLLGSLEIFQNPGTILNPGTISEGLDLFWDHFGCTQEPFWKPGTMSRLLESFRNPGTILGPLAPFRSGWNHLATAGTRFRSTLLPFWNHLRTLESFQNHWHYFQPWKTITEIRNVKKDKWLRNRLWRNHGRVSYPRFTLHVGRKNRGKATRRLYKPPASPGVHTAILRYGVVKHLLWWPLSKQ